MPSRHHPVTQRRRFSVAKAARLTLRRGLLAMLLLGMAYQLAADEPASHGEPWVQAVGATQYFALYVTDMDRSAAWYQEVFGLEKLVGSGAENGAWEIQNLGNERLLVELIRDSRAQDVDRALGFRKVGFAVDDVERVADRIEQATGERPRIVDFEPMGQRILQIRDPDGNTIQLFSVLSTGN